MRTAESSHAQLGKCRRADLREGSLVAISPATPRRGVIPGLRRLSLRGQLLLQVVVISVIAFSVSFFAIWGLHRTGALLQDVRTSVGPAKSALQLANGLE